MPRVPKSLWIFVHDRYRDYLKGILAREIKRQELMEHITHISYGRSQNDTYHDHVKNNEARIAIQQFIESVSPALRSVLTLRIEGWTNKEIASLLEISESTVSRHVSRLREIWIDTGQSMLCC